MYTSEGIIRFAVFGAGGIGGYLGSRLAESGEEVAIIARGDHLTAIRNHGLRVDSIKDKSLYSLLPLPPITPRKWGQWT